MYWLKGGSAALKRDARKSTVDFAHSFLFSTISVEERERLALPFWLIGGLVHVPLGRLF